MVSSNWLVVLLIRMGHIKEVASLKRKEDRFYFRSAKEITWKQFWLDIRKRFLIVLTYTEMISPSPGVFKQSCV